MLLEILISVGGIVFVSTVLYFLIDIITDLQPSLFPTSNTAARQMRESEEQIREILERLKNESVVPTLTPPTPSASVSVTGEGKTVTLSGSPDMYGWKV